MTAPAQWHLDADLVARYRAGLLPPPAQASVDAHVVGCRDCQRKFAPDAAANTGPAAGRQHTEELDRVWASIVDVVDRPRPGPLERLLRAVGVREDLARLVAATPSLQGAWLVAVALTLAFAIAAARAGDGSGLAPLLLIAPLVPVAGTGAAFGSSFDPIHEITLATPVHGFRLLLTRTIAVLLASVAIGAVASLAVRGGGWEALAWVLPSFALTAATLALATWTTPTAAAVATVGGWVVAVVAFAFASAGGVGARRLPIDGMVDALLVDGGGQLLFAVLAVAFFIVASSRRDAFDQRSPA